jgi:hypothetical protein
LTVDTFTVKKNPEEKKLKSILKPPSPSKTFSNVERSRLHLNLLNSPNKVDSVETLRMIATPLNWDLRSPNFDREFAASNKFGGQEATNPFCLPKNDTSPKINKIKPAKAGGQPLARSRFSKKKETPTPPPILEIRTEISKPTDTPKLAMIHHADLRGGDSDLLSIDERPLFRTEDPTHPTPSKR